jgi:GT2 family glycosyltransferase
MSSLPKIDPSLAAAADNPKDGTGHSAPATNEKLDSRDVANIFNLFLGRSAIDLPSASFNGDLGVLLQDILHGDDFRNSVLSAILLRENLPHDTLGDAPPLRLIDWVQRRLPLTAATRLAVGGARTWTQLLELLLADRTFVAVAPYLAEAEVDGLLRQRMENEPWSKIKRSVIGVVDAASGFEMRGWAVDLCDKSVPVLVEFFADGLFLGSTLCNEPRPDVMDAVGGDGRCGFTFKIAGSHRASFAGGRTLVAVDSVSRAPIATGPIVYADAARHWDAISATRNELAQLRQALDRIEARLPEIDRMSSIPIDAYEEYWERFYRPSPDVLAEQRSQSGVFTYRPLISVVVPTWNSDLRLLCNAIDSVRAQSYERWEIVISDDASEGDELGLLRRRYEAEPRIHWLKAFAREGIAINTNRGIAAAQGDYIAFLDHDDELAPDAFFSVALALQEQRYSLIYSDEDRIDEDSEGGCVHHTPFFKPGFDPDLLLAHNYICHLVVLRRDSLTAAGGLRNGFEGAQDHDLLLRVVAGLADGDILHLPRVLYHWRVTEGSFSRSAAGADAIQKNIVTAVEEHLRERNCAAKVEAHRDSFGQARQFATRVRWPLPDIAPRVSIIIATRDRVDLLRPCLTSVLDSLPAYPGESEVLLVNNDSVETETLSYFDGLAELPHVRLLPFRGSFNWSALNNVAAREASGEVLIFLNNDTLVLAKDWCAELVANAIRDDVGAVGARLLYADGTIQHAGVVLGVEGVAGHEAVGESPGSGGYFGRSHLQRSAAAVTGACLATRRALFLQMDGGFDDLNLKVAFNDVDYCMKVRKAGHRVVYNPFAVLYHLESKSRGREESEAKQARHRREAAFFRSKWQGSHAIDPYYNPHFERFARPFERLRPPCALQPPAARRHPG